MISQAMNSYSCSVSAPRARLARHSFSLLSPEVGSSDVLPGRNFFRELGNKGPVEGVGRGSERKKCMLQYAVRSDGTEGRTGEMCA